MHKLLSLLFAALLGVAQAGAVPAKPTPLTLQQPDGTTITVLLVGDESFHYYQTLDGVPLVRHDDGSLHYACLQGNLLSSTGVLAHEAAQRTPDETRLVLQQAATLSALQQIGSARTAERNAQRAARRTAARQPASRAVGEPTYPVGERKGIVILVNYQDVKMKDKHTNAVFTDMMNKEGYTDFGNASSVHDYFKDQSYGQLDLTFDVVGPVTVAGNMADYGRNDYHGSDGTTAAKMVYEACQLADKEVDFADYDLLFLPGGMPGTNNLAACGPLVAAVDAFVAEGRDVAAICAAPAVVLARRGLLRGRRATSNPNFQHEIAENGGVVVADERVVVDGSVLTSQGMGTATDLGLAIVGRYLGEDAVAEAKQKIVYWG